MQKTGYKGEIIGDKRKILLKKKPKVCLQKIRV